MGQKVNPHGLRVGITKYWDSMWYSDKKHFSDLLIEDYNVRKILKKELYNAGVSKILIERGRNIKAIVKVSKSGIALGKNGSNIERVKNLLEKNIKKEVDIDIEEVKNGNKESQLVAENIALQLENRIPFRRVLKKVISDTMKTGILGIKASVSGRLNGVDIARTEHYIEGNIPLQTLMADIDYGFAEADTTYGKIGVKVWIYHGKIFKKKKNQKQKENKEELKNSK